MAPSSEISWRWRGHVVLKRDVFSTVERGTFRTPQGDVDAVLRRIDEVPWWSWPLARHLFNRERKALARIAALDIGPPLLYAGRRELVRGWIDGVALHLARPYGDRNYFHSAKAALHKLHRAGVCHNDLAKEQNWLRGADGRAYLTDFQLAIYFRRRSRLFRIAAYEDLRHLLKHKRRYLQERLTPSEQRTLARKSWFTRAWMATGKKVYRWITRGLFRFTDREGGGPRLVQDAPLIQARLRQHPAVRDACVVAFPDRRSGTGLYAFVETDAVLPERELRIFLSADRKVAAPEHVQVIDALPRDAAGEVRTEILQLIAMNQVDLVDGLLASDSERALVANIIAGRRNLRDRFAF
ncbi:MAG TPA: serine/threonine protein kinase [Xanthobacteraceae bacterium]|nr:serine/threonine protein kinase [Xanthobacteraceae bacterium]